MTTARRLHQHMRSTGRPQTVLTIVSDDHATLCLTEADLDVWWQSLPPHEKADLFERELEAPPDLAQNILDEAQRVSGAFAKLNTLQLDQHGKPMPW